MSAPAPLTIVNVGYRSTNFWVVSVGRSRLLVDLGWPGMVRPLLANLARKGIPLAEIVYGLATHYHIDHAGAAEDLKRLGMRLLVIEEQQSAIPRMKRWIKPDESYTEIVAHDNVVLRTSASRELLAAIGIAGEIVHTPGHSDDSVSLVLDNGAAFTGDLPPEALASAEDRAQVARSWHTLHDRGAATIYAGHGPVRPLHAGESPQPSETP